MKILVIAPTTTMCRHLKSLRINYEIVESAASMSEKFMGHDGFFDGVIAPNNVTPQELKVIANNNFVQLRELPIFVFGSAAVAKQRLTHIRADRITCVYRNNLRKELQAWTNTIAMSA